MSARQRRRASRQDFEAFAQRTFRRFYTGLGAFAEVFAPDDPPQDPPPISAAQIAFRDTYYDGVYHDVNFTFELDRNEFDVWAVPGLRSVAEGAVQIADSEQRKREGATIENLLITLAGSKNVETTVGPVTMGWSVVVDCGGGEFDPDRVETLIENALVGELLNEYDELEVTVETWKVDIHFAHPDSDLYSEVEEEKTPPRPRRKRRRGPDRTRRRRRKAPRGEVFGTGEEEDEEEEELKEQVDEELEEELRQMEELSDEEAQDEFERWIEEKEEAERLEEMEEAELQSMGERYEQDQKEERLMKSRVDIVLKRAVEQTLKAQKALILERQLRGMAPLFPPELRAARTEEVRQQRLASTQAVRGMTVAERKSEAPSVPSVPSGRVSQTAEQWFDTLIVGDHEPAQQASPQQSLFNDPTEGTEVPDFQPLDWDLSALHHLRRGNRGGRCASGGGVVVFKGLKYMSVKGGEGECGGRVVWTGLKTNKSRISESEHKRLRNWRNFLILTSRVCGRAQKSREDWTMREMGEVVSYFGGTLVVYSSDDPTRIIYGEENGLCKFCVRVMLAERGSLLSDEDGRAHFLLRIDVNRVCEKCGQPDETSFGKRHRCTVQCVDCGVWYTANNVSHVCALVMKQLVLAEEERVKELKHAREEKKAEAVVSNSTSLSSAFANEVKKEIEEIMSDRCDDEQVIEEWKGAISVGHSVALYGDAGTGKSYLTKECVVEMISTGVVSGGEIAVVCAEAVGVVQYEALKRLGVFVGTLHSWLSMRPQDISNPNARIAKIVEDDGDVVRRTVTLKVLVFEEFSSMEFDLLNVADLFHRRIRASGQCFGGVQLMVTGDFRQKPPIAMRRVGEGRLPIFMSVLYGELGLKVFKLKKQRRLIDMNGEGNKLLLRAQLEMSRGVISSRTLERLNLEIFRDGQLYLDDPQCVQLVSNNRTVWEVGVAQIQRFYSAASVRVYKGVGECGSKYNSLYDEELYAHVGAPCMFTSNKYMKQYNVANGSLGTMVDLSDDVIKVRTENGHVIEVVREKVSRGYKQFCIRLAYARTVHKSQGATLPAVALHLRTASEREGSGDVALCYVGMSRVADISKLTLVGERLRAQHIVFNPLAVMYMELCDKYVHVEVISRIRSAMGHGLKMVAYNNRAYSETLSCMRKRTFDKPHDFWARGTPRPTYAHELWNGKVFFDFETGPLKASDRVGDSRRVEEVYSVFARYWESQLKTTEFKLRKSDSAGCLGDFVDWLNTLADVSVQKWISSSYKKHKAPILLVAYNGSNFDFTFVMKRLLHKSNGRHYIFKPSAIKGSKIICCDICITHNGTEKVVFQFWDPFLITGLSLNNAHKAFCVEKHSLVKKGVFPHTYVHRVGVLRAFSQIGETELNIQRDFPPAMREQVGEMINRNELREGSGGSGTVLFDLQKEHDDYVETDVNMMEDVYESLNELLMKKAPLENLMVSSFPTVASMSFYLSLLKMDPQVRGVHTDSRLESNIFLMNRRLEKKVRCGMYGGRCINRATEYTSSDMDMVMQKVAEKSGREYKSELLEEMMQRVAQGETLTVADYERVQDALVYLDVNGMYHYIMQNCNFPYGMHMEVVDAYYLVSLLRQFEREGDRADFPMFFMQLDVYPNPHENESCLPSRDSKFGRLRWDNQPKIQQVYNCVHLRLACERGFRLENPSWAVVWGGQEESGKWVGKKCKIFKEVMDEYEEDRGFGGARKTFGKLCANTTGGSMAKRDFMTKVEVFTAEPGQECPRLKELMEVVKDPEWKCIYSELSVNEEGRCVLVKKFRFLGDEENVMGKRAPQMWGYIMAYAHCMLEKACEGVFGENRRGGNFRYQPANGDTDSLFLPWNMCVNDRINLHPKKLGMFSDDLSDYYNVPYSCDAKGRPRFAKILQMSAPQKKLYALTCILPDGRLIQTKPKSKGIGKQANMIILTGKEYDQVKLDCKFDHKLASQDPSKERRLIERIKLERALMQKGNFTTALTTSMLIKAARTAELGGIVAVRRVWKSHGFTVAPHLITNGVEFFSKECELLTRRVRPFLFFLTHHCF